MADNIKVEPLTSMKFLNMYNLTIEHNGKTLHWTIASRRKAEELVANGGRVTPDAVAMEVIVEKDGKEYVMVIEQYRPGVNRLIVEYPAGLVEENEHGNEAETAKREVTEETGGVVDSIEPLTDTYLSSPGCVDETKQVYRCIVHDIGEQDLQDEEEITVRLIPIEEIPDYLKEVKERGLVLDSVAATRLPALYKERMLERENEELRRKIAILEAKQEVQDRDDEIVEITEEIEDSLNSTKKNSRK